MSEEALKVDFKRSETEKKRKNGKRLRDIRRLLLNDKIKLSEEKRLELETEAKNIEETILKNSSSQKKKLERYLQYKKNKQKTMRFVELVKIKRKINKLQNLVIGALKTESSNSFGCGMDTLTKGSEDKAVMNEEVEASSEYISKIKSEIALLKKYEDYIRLSPFFKERRYIPLFSTTELDQETIAKRERFIEDVQVLKEKLRLSKLNLSKMKELSVGDSFLVQEDGNAASNDESNSHIHNSIQKIQYSINMNNTSNEKRSRKPRKAVQKGPKKNTQVVAEKKNNHVIFSDSD
ncbi:rRNA-processing protein Efg1 [Cryptosporidium felis]|nr:rRNA-processing protein Efg1 [Cryptosporidium felis]